jgi:hypothetical protein
MASISIRKPIGKLAACGPDVIHNPFGLYPNIAIPHQAAGLRVNGKLAGDIQGSTPFHQYALTVGS